MAKKIYDTDGLDMRKANWDGDESTGGLPVSGRLVENYIKSVDDKAAGTDEVVSGETKTAQAGAVADALTGMVTGIDVTDSDDGTQYVMSFKTRKGDGTDEDSEVRFSKYTDDDKVVVNVDLTDSSGSSIPASQFLSLGSGFVMNYIVSVGTAGGSEVDGYSNLQARVIVKRGNTVLGAFQNAEFVNVSAGQQYTFDAGQYLTDASAYTVQVKARCTYGEATLNRTASARVTMVAMTLGSTFNVSNGLAGGGYSNNVTVPFTLTGTTGEKTLYYRLNGGETFNEPMSTGSGTQSRNIIIGLGSMTEGRNVLEVYAKHEASGVISEVYYITLLKAGAGVTDYAGIMFHHKANGFQTVWNAPVMNVEQFTAWSFDYAGYNRAQNRAVLGVLLDGATVKEDSLLRTEKGSYGKTNVTTEELSYSIVCGGSSIGVTVQTTGHTDIKATLTSDAVCSFDAYGRSNTENDAATWKSGDLEMSFKNVLWQVNENGAGSGWYNDRLLLSNGASMQLTKAGSHYYPFYNDEKPVGQAIGDVGMTIEIEFSTANVTDTSAELITCLGVKSDGNRYGFVVTPEEVKFLTGTKTEVEDAGEKLIYEDNVGTKYKPNTNIKIAYTFYPNISTNEQRTLIGFFVDGVESASSRWTGKVNFDIQSELTFKSEGADLLVKNVRIYNKALSDDESLNNYIVDRNHLEDVDGEKGVRTLDEQNRVLDESGKVSLAKLLALLPKRKNSCLIFIGTGSVKDVVPVGNPTMNVLDALAQKNDKKADKLVKKIIFYNGEYPEQSFIAANVLVRIQGTSSVNYARKNWRIYFQKTAGETDGIKNIAILSYGEIDSDGNQKDPIVTTGKGNLFKLRPNSVGVKLACPKCDFTDSSMTTNTGGAKFFNDGMKEMELFTPAQAYARDHNVSADYRTAIDGIPCDLFATMEDMNDLTYYGQYNINNDKSDSYPIFGQDKTIGEEKWGEGGTLDYLTADDSGNKQYLPIAIETLNNSNPCCLFQWVPSTDAAHTSFMDRYFDGGLELNHPKDTFWNSGKGDAAEEPNMKEHLGTGDKYDKMYKAIDRLMSFIHKCVKETVAGKNMAYNTDSGTFSGIDYTDDGDKFPSDKWKSAYFKAHAREYLNVEFLMAYYMFVDFNLGVDQLAKNILWRTWDGRIWYSTWYDGDCQLGNDNRSMLTGIYDDNRQTKRNNAYVMQGHNSWIWNLLIANFSDLRETLITTGVNGGSSFVSAFSVQKALYYFNTEQMDRWCERLYNKSGIFKYIYPYLNGLPTENGILRLYGQIYGMKGNLKAHRGYFVSRRYDLKQVEYGYMSTNGGKLYQSTSSQNAGYKMHDFTFVLTIPYRVQLSIPNGVQADSGVVAANTRVTLSFPISLGENDPLNIIGAEKIKELIWHEDAFAGEFEFDYFISLVYLDMSVEVAGQYRNGSRMAGTQNMTLLETLIMTNNRIARNGEDGNTATLDLSFQSRLKEVRLGGTGLEKVTLATGCPVTTLVLPDTLTELFLEYLPNLKESGLTLSGIKNITGYRHAATPGIDGMALLERLHEAKASGGKLERFSLTVDTEDDGTLLEKYKDYKTYRTDGTNDNLHSGLKGTVRMTRFLSDEEMARYGNIYDGLTIIQPEYTVIKHYETISDGTAFSNLDNKTGYDYDNNFVPSGHVERILAQRYRCLGKNTASGEETIIKLDDSNSNHYAEDGSAAVLTGADGDVWMYEPNYWYKGVNDLLHKTKYRIFSSLENEPTKPEGVRLTQDKLERTMESAIRITEGYGTLSEAVTSNSDYSYYTVDVRGYRQVRFPGVAFASYGAVFLDENDNIVSRLEASRDSGYINGMYLFSTIPENAKRLALTVYDRVDFGYVLLTHSDKVEDIEPDWVFHEECLTAVYEASVRDDKMRSISGMPSIGSVSQEDCKTYAQNRGAGFKLVDWEMHKDVCNLFYVKYGNTNSQLTCGPGTHAYNRTTGASDATGMQDTKPTAKDGDPLPTISNNYYNGNAYVLKNADDKQRTAIGSPVCMGYENWYGNKSEWIDDTFNEGVVDFSMHITMPDGSTRKLKGTDVAGECYPSSVVHGLYMDVWNSYSGGSMNSGFYDMNYIDGSTNRVVYRSGSYASAFGGVAYAYTFVDSAAVNARVGSRLAFRGKIVKAQSVAAFKALREVQ